MRCPKCGYISFDNLETCLKCSKDISDATQAFQGSTLKVEAPSFLKVSVTEDDGLEIEGAAEMDGDIEFADPDLEILVDEDDDDGEGIDFNLDDGDEDNSGDSDLALAEEFGEVESFGDDDDDLNLSADLGQFEDVPEEDSFSFEDTDDETDELLESIPMDIPDELADISDLSPPDSSDVEEAVVEFEQAEAVDEDQSPAEPEDDLDFSNLDMDFDLGDTGEAGDRAAMDEAATSVAKKAPGVSSSDMDEELNFDLDLGGLTIHDDSKS